MNHTPKKTTLRGGRVQGVSPLLSHAVGFSGFVTQRDAFRGEGRCDATGDILWRAQEAAGAGFCEPETIFAQYRAEFACGPPWLSNT
jgi:hypothetical protein